MDKLYELIEECWRIYKCFEKECFIVKPSIPILFFGDHEKYLSSKTKILTVGLNPSKREFPSDEPFRRFPNIKNIYQDLLKGKCYKEYLRALDNYFRNDPYCEWFDSFEPILNSFDCSYYDKESNTALHTDLCSPLATEPSWSKLSNNQKKKLESEGIKLWHHLIKSLSPDILLISIGKEHLKKINFPLQTEWKDTSLKEIKLAKMKIGNTSAHVIWGKPTRIPFGAISCGDKRKIGSLIGKEQLNDPEK